MTKRGPRKRGGRKRQSPTSRFEIVMGSEKLTVDPSNATVTTVPLVPASFTRALAIADSFAFYRFKKIRVAIHPNVPPSGTVQTALTAGYLAGVVPDTPPATSANVFNLTRSMHHGYGKTNPTVMNLNSQDLIADTQVKWFKTIAGTPDSQFEVQGNFYFAPDTSGTPTTAFWIVTYDYVLELQSFVPASSSPFQKFVYLSEEEKRASVMNVGGDPYLRLTTEMLRALKLQPSAKEVVSALPGPSVVSAGGMRIPV